MISLLSKIPGRLLLATISGRVCWTAQGDLYRVHFPKSSVEYRPKTGDLGLLNYRGDCVAEIPARDLPANLGARIRDNVEVDRAATLADLFAHL